MSRNGPDRRDFLKMAGISAAGLGARPQACHGLGPASKGGLPEDADMPFSSLAEIFKAPRSTYFGVKVEEREETFGNGQSGRPSIRLSASVAPETALELAAEM
jgi:hypothetical protein